MYEVQLQDNRTVTCHVDQLRSRIGTDNESASESTTDCEIVDTDIPSPPQNRDTASDPSDSGEPEASPTTPPTERDEAGDTSEIGETEHAVEREESSGTQLRRSARVRQPPVRFDEQNFQVTVD